MAETHHLFQRNCKKCGCPLAFFKTGEGKLIPLDLRAPVYTVEAFDKEGKVVQEAVRSRSAYPSHFSTCAYADDFSKQ